MAAALAVAVALHLLWRTFRLPSPWPRLLLGTVGRIAGARVRTIGTPLRRDVIILANHVSWIDVLVIAGTTGAAFVARDDLRQAPLIGWLCTLNRTIFVRREDRMAVAEQVAAVREAIAERYPVALFPEGTTGDGRALLPFKPALLAVFDAPLPGVQVQPVVVDYGAAVDLVAWVGEESGADHAIRLLSRAGSFPVTLHFLAPFDPTGFAGRKAIAAEARRRIVDVGLPAADASA